jgi:tRNA pseudouridine55 synthase
LASGLLIVCSDGDTKRINEFMGMEKIYQTTIDLSRDSDTWDTDIWEREKEYQLTNHKDQGRGIEKDGKFAPAPSEDDIDDFLQSLHGTHDLPLTPFSAKKVDGKKLYEYAREGNPKFLTVPMTIKGHEILSYNFPHVQLELHVSKGTYIRSIAHYIGIHF